MREVKGDLHEAFLYYLIINYQFKTRELKKCREVVGANPRGCSRDFKRPGWSKDIFGFEIFDSGIFLGSLNKHECSISYVFLCVIALPLSGTFLKGPQNRHGIFWGLIFGPGNFLGFAGSIRAFFWSWLLAPFDHPGHLKSRLPPLGSKQFKP